MSENLEARNSFYGTCIVHTFEVDGMEKREPFQSFQTKSVEIREITGGNLEVEGELIIFVYVCPQWF